MNKLKVLINAYAFSPEMGSEPGMGWNWCVNLAKHCELFIITEGEFRNTIEAIVPTLPQRGNMHLYYNPVSERVRRMCWNQGDWRFYIHYKRWQKRTADIAREICRQERIDILHQLNMIGFREPGYLWKVSQETGIPFVWGPIGGLKQFPLKYLEGAGYKMILFNQLKNRLNVIQLKYGKRVDKAIKHASILISSIPDSYHAIKKYKHKESIIIPETGCYNTQEMVDKKDKTNANGLKLLWVGKFDFRKRLDIALETVSKLKHLSNLKLIVCGTGSDYQVDYYHKMANNLNIANMVNWKGQMSNSQIHAEMKSADLLFFTSVNEDTSTVVLEAISNSLPVICHDACGFGYVIDEKVGIKIPLSSPKQSVVNFALQLERVYKQRQFLIELADNCIKFREKFSWQSKCNFVYTMYQRLLSNQ